MGNLEIALNAALKGPEKKKIKLFNHEFNVKPVEIITSGNIKRATGQLSHVLAWRPDDQVYYTITKKDDGTIKGIKIKISRGGGASYIAALASITSDVLIGVPIPSSSIESVSRKLGRILEGGWEDVAEYFIDMIALSIPTTHTSKDFIRTVQLVNAEVHASL